MITPDSARNASNDDYCSKGNLKSEVKTLSWIEVELVPECWWSFHLSVPVHALWSVLNWRWTKTNAPNPIRFFSRRFPPISQLSSLHFRYFDVMQTCGACCTVECDATRKCALELDWKAKQERSWRWFTAWPWCSACSTAQCDSRSWKSTHTMHSRVLHARGQSPLQLAS